MTTVFLSYARGDDVEPFDQATSFVARLHRDLTAAGFDAWYDKDDMGSKGLTFHQEILNAIAARERLVLIVGPQAVASAYVQQEWQFAWREADKVVTPILRLGDYPILPDELKLLHCEDFRDDAQYLFHLDNLIRQLRAPAPPLGKLIAVPSLPPRFLARAERLSALRDALRADLNRPVVIGGAAARVGVHGMGGIGKSVLAAALGHDRKIREAFTDGIVWVGLGTLPDVVALQRRVHRDLGDDGAFESEHQGKEALRKQLADKAVLLVLDNVWRRSDVDSFDVLGPRCRALITTRDTGLLTVLWGTHHVLDLLTDHEAYSLLALTAGVAPDSLPVEAAALIAECGRLPLAVALCGGMIRRGLAWSGVLQQLKQARIDRIADRHAVEPHHQSAWHAIHVSVEYLPAVEKQRFLELAVFPPDEPTPESAIGTLWASTGKLDEWGTQEMLFTLRERSLVQPVIERSGASQVHGRSALLHDLVYDYARRVVPDEKTLQDQLLAAYWAKCPDGWQSGPNDGYFFTHLRQHLVAAGRAGELADLLHELRWLEAKNEAGLTFDLTADFRAALDALSAGDSRSVILGLLDEALRRETHFIARHSQDYPQALFQCLWNPGWWYDSPEAASHYQPPPGGWPPGGAPWERSGPKLCTLMERWGKAKEQRTRHFDWLRSLRPPETPLGGNQLLIIRGHEDWVRSVVFDPNGRRLASGSDDGTVRIWDAGNGAELNCLRGHESGVFSVAIDPTGRRLASGSIDGTVRIWDATSGVEIACLRGHKGGIISVAFDLTGRRVAVACGLNDDTVRIWDIASGTELACLRGHKRGIESVAFDPTGRRLASGSDDGTIRVWDAATGAEIACLRGHKSDVTSVQFDPTGPRLASGSNDGTIRIWDTASGAEIACLTGHESAVHCVAYDVSGARLASGSWDLTVRVWDAKTGAEVACLSGHEHAVRSVAFDPAGRFLASGSDDRTVRIWDTARGATSGTLPGHTNRVKCIVFDPTGQRFASGSDDGTVRVWDAATGVPLFCLDGQGGWVESVAFDPTGRLVAGGMLNGTVRVWDATTGIVVACPRGHNNYRVHCVAFDSTGRFVASGADDGNVRIWDAATGAQVASLSARGGDVYSVAFDPSGRFLACGGGPYIGTVQVWHAETYAEFGCLSGRAEAVQRLAFDRTGQHLASSAHGETRIWNTTTWQCSKVLSSADEDHATAEQAAMGFALRARTCGLETVVWSQESAKAIAWFSPALSTFSTHSSGLMWAGSAGIHVYLIRLAGRRATR